MPSPSARSTVTMSSGRSAMGSPEPRIRGTLPRSISIASPAMPEERVETHRILLGYYDPGRSVVILEDCRLDFDLTGLKRVLALPPRKHSTRPNTSLLSTTIRD